MSEKEHIIGLSRENHESFRAIFDLYYPKVRYFISHIVKSDAVAEELAQDVFVKLWEIRERVAGFDTLGPYVYRMSRNAAINYLDHKFVELSLTPKYRDIVDNTPEEEFIALETSLLIELTVNSMPEQRKRVYRMSREEHLSNDEISQKLNITKKSVENHLNLALNEIRKAIKVMLLFFM